MTVPQPLGKEWRPALTLDSNRQCIGGSNEELIAAIRRGADLRIYTEFYYDEHIDTSSESHELVKEVSEFRLTYLLDERWIAGLMTLRMPVLPPTGFGPRPSMSFFLYNQDGTQAIARPHLDGEPRTGPRGSSPVPETTMPKYRQLDLWDAETNAPSQNFIYNFETYRFHVRDDWQEVLSHDAQGHVHSGSFETLTQAFTDGATIKLAVRGLATDVCDAPTSAPEHEVFVETGSGYLQTEREIFSAGTHPVVRVRPAIPLRYTSEAWDFGWLMARTDGLVERWLVDPYTLKFEKSQTRHAMRWLAR